MRADLWLRYAWRDLRSGLQGFWIFLASNALWVAWGVHDHAYALVGLQFFLAALNIRGVYKNE